MSSPLMFVRDGRTMPFVPVTMAALRAIRAVEPKNAAIARSVYLALLELANDARADRATVTLREIGEVAGASRDSVRRAHGELVEAGVLEIVEHYHASGRLENEYLLKEPETPPLLTATRVQNSAPTLLTATTPVAVSNGVPLEGKKNERERDAQAPEPTGPENSPVAVLCHRLADLRRPFDPSATPTAAGWEGAAELLLKERKLSDALELIAWLPTDSFWVGRVLSPQDLAKHFTRLLGVREAERRQAVQAPPSKRGRQVAEQHRRSVELTAVAGSCCSGDVAPHPAEFEWADLAPKLRAEVGDELFDVWLAGAHPHAGEHDQLLIGVSEHVRAWVSDRWAPAIERAAGRPIELVVCQEAA